MLNVSLWCTKENHRNLTKVLLILIVYMLNLLIRVFSVERVANYCRISQIPVLVFLYTKCPLTTIRSRFSADEVHIVGGEI